MSQCTFKWELGSANHIDFHGKQVKHLRSNSAVTYNDIKKKEKKKKT